MASGWFSVARIGEHSERVLFSSFTAIVRRSRTFANFSSFGHAGPSLTSLGDHLSFLFVSQPLQTRVLLDRAYHCPVPDENPSTQVFVSLQAAIDEASFD